MKGFPPERIRNVAVVGHGGTGKTSLVEAMITFFFFLPAISKTTSVPLMLVSIVRTGLSPISRTPPAAARCMSG